MNVGYVVFSGACLLAGLAYQFGDLGVNDNDDVVADDTGSYSRPVGEDWQDRQTANSAYVVTLNAGANLDDVLNSLGEPDFAQDFDNNIIIVVNTKITVLKSQACKQAGSREHDIANVHDANLHPVLSLCKVRL